MPSYPALDVETKINHSPHVVILGAGASIASTIRNPEASRKVLPGMASLVEVLELQDLLEEYGVSYADENFEKLYDGLVSGGEHSALVAKLENEIHHYFSQLKLPDEATIYDYLVLSLREKDIIATFNWDPFLAQAFIRNMDLIGYERMPQMAYLHGNVAVGVCYDCCTKGWIENWCTECNKGFKPSKLLYPVSKKDYASDSFIKSEWDHLRAHLRRTYYITVFGYSAPKTDAEARQLLLSEWEADPVRPLAEIDIVDILAASDRPNLEANWKEFFVGTHYSVFETVFQAAPFRNPRRSCDAFAMATLQQSPWPTNNFPADMTLPELQEWVMPLIQEEKLGRFSGKTCTEIRMGQ